MSVTFLSFFVEHKACFVRDLQIKQEVEHTQTHTKQALHSAKTQKGYTQMKFRHSSEKCKLVLGKIKDAQQNPGSAVRRNPGKTDTLNFNRRKNV